MFSFLFCVQLFVQQPAIAADTSMLNVQLFQRHQHPFTNAPSAHGQPHAHKRTGDRFYPSALFDSWLVVPLIRWKIHCSALQALAFGAKSETLARRCIASRSLLFLRSNHFPDSRALMCDAAICVPTIILLVQLVEFETRACGNASIVARSLPHRSSIRCLALPLAVRLTNTAAHSHTRHPEAVRDTCARALPPVSSILTQRN